MDGIVNRDNFLAATQGIDITHLSDARIGQEIEDLLKESYDSTLSPSQNVIAAIQTGKFPTAYPVTLKGLSISLENTVTRINIPENVTLENCEVIRGQVYFCAGELAARSNEAAAFANGNGAIADATVAGARASATIAGAKAAAMASGAVANALESGAVAMAMASGAIANAAAKGTKATAMTSGAIANATTSGAEAYAMTSDAVVNATAFGAKAYAMTSDSVANAKASGAKAIAMVSDAVANATVPGSVAKTYKANPDTYQGRRNVRAHLPDTKGATPEKNFNATTLHDFHKPIEKPGLTVSDVGAQSPTEDRIYPDNYALAAF